MEISAREGDPPWITTAKTNDFDGDSREIFRKMIFFMEKMDKFISKAENSESSMDRAMMNGKMINRDVALENRDVEEDQGLEMAARASSADRNKQDEACLGLGLLDKPTSNQASPRHGMGLQKEQGKGDKAFVCGDGLGPARKTLLNGDGLHTMVGMGLHMEHEMDGQPTLVNKDGLGLNNFSNVGQPINLSNSPNKVTTNKTIHVGNSGPSYANVVNQHTKAFNDPMVSLGNIPAPILRAGKIIVEIPDDLVDRCIANATFDLIGRIQYRKGDNPLSLKDLKLKIQNFWKIEKDWKLAPIGRGFFYCRFSSNEDKMRAWAMPWLKTNPGIFKLSKWIKDFNPYKYNATTTNVWVRMFGLSGEMFNPEVMIRIAKGVGTPILVDKASSNFDYAHFARVLVEVDLADKLPSSVFISVKGTEKEIEIQFENLPSFCEHCSLIGHDKLDCRNLIRLLDEKRRNEEKHGRKRSRSRTRQAPVEKNNPVGPVEKAKGNDGTWVEVKNNKNNKKKDIDVAQQSQQGNINTFNNFACLDSVDTNTLDNEKTENTKDITIGDNVINIESGDNNISTDVEMEENEGNIIVEEGESLIGDNFDTKEGEKDIDDVSPMEELGNMEKEAGNNEKVNIETLPINVENKDNLEDTENSFVPETLQEWRAHISKSWADEAEKEDEEFKKLIECVEAKQDFGTSSLYDDNWGEEEPCYVTKPAYNNSNYTYVEH